MLDDEENDDLAAGSGLAAMSPQDAIAVYHRKNAEFEAAQKRLQDLWSRTAQQISARRAGPSMAEQMFALSAALTSPTRSKGYAGFLQNVMPVMGQFASARRQDEEARQELLSKYGFKSAEMDLDAANRGLQSASRAYAAAMKPPPKARRGLDPLGRGVVDLETAAITPFGAGDLPQPRSAAERDALPPGTEYLAPDGSRKRKAGGPTQGASGNFPSGNPLDP